ncbi:MAG TPA: serine hydrolase, partial [Gemmatimonadaceae bacterium]|nr:serine hydrolase [Gemmatimonadaceae bacterium]
MLARICCLLAIGMVLPPAKPQPSAPINFVGLWEAKRHFGPEVRGTLVIDRAAGQWRASIAGRTAIPGISGDTISFTLPDSSASFRGHWDRARKLIVGQWIEGRRAFPLTLGACAVECYAADVRIPDNELTLYLKVVRRPDGSFGAFLRNPERNLGRFIRVDRIEGDSSDVRWLDKKGGVILHGVMRDDVMTVYIANRGGSFDFHRVPEGSFTWFYPRGHPSAPYVYVPPRAQDDGWPVARLKDVGMSERKMTDFVQTLIDNPVDSLGALYLHGLLIARHGKLVLEEYFYGEDADKPHDTRSAAKAVLDVMIGAAALKGAKITPETRVYSVMRPTAQNLDQRKKALTVENLLNMASGLDCDDNGDDHPGNEDNVTDDDAHPDWYRVILDLNMIRNPGDTAVYCSINPHLAGGVLSRVTGRPLPELMWDLIGQPLQMRDYSMFLTPLGEGYMGGMMSFRLRDFSKIGQLYLDGGTWHGRRIVSADWVKRSTVPRYAMSKRLKYGYLWWMIEYPYQGRTVQAYFASGNGGNEAVVVPALDLVIAV